MTISSLPFNLSKKVAWPAAVLALVGVVLLILWLILDRESGTESTLFKIAMSAFGAAGIQLPVGYRAPADEVVQDVGEASDDVLSASAQEQVSASLAQAPPTPAAETAPPPPEPPTTGDQAPQH